MSTAIEAPAPSEAGMVGAETADAYRRRVEYYRRDYKLPTPEAVARAEEPAPPECLDRCLNGPPDQASWADLQILAERDPALAQQRWEEIKQAAREELRSKQRAAKALEGYGGDPWDRAQYLALCRELADGWQPRCGIERQLLDTMAQAQTTMLGWLTQLSHWVSWPIKKDQYEGAAWNPPRLTEAEAVEQAAGMVERFQRIFTRALRSLVELRRRPLAVVVQGAGQVNVGERQVNVSG